MSQTATVRSVDSLIVRERRPARTALPLPVRLSVPKHFVYGLRSLTEGKRFYTGVTRRAGPHRVAQRWPMPSHRRVSTLGAGRRRGVRERRPRARLRARPQVRLRSSVREAPRWLRDACCDQLPVRARLQEWARSGKSGCARCWGVALSTRPDSTACTRWNQSSEISGSSHHVSCDAVNRVRSRCRRTAGCAGACRSPVT